MTLLIIAITSVVSFFAFTNSDLVDRYKFSPFKIKREGQHYRWITHGFIHADLTHLLFNMLTLYFFGGYGEQIFGPLFVLFYLTAIVVSSLPDFIQNKDNPYYSAIGASGAVSAVLFSLVLFAPWEIIRINFILPLYFVLYAVLYLAYSVYMSRRNMDNIGHMAHFTGAVYGIVATIIVRPESLSYFLSSILHPPFLK